MFSIPSSSIFASFVISLFFWLAAYFVSKTKNFSCLQKALTAHWITAGTIFFLFGFSSTIFHLFPEIYTFGILYDAAIFFVLQAFLGIYYILLKMVSSSKLRYLALLVTGGFLAYYLFYLFTRGVTYIRGGEPYLEASSSTPQGYGFGATITLIISFAVITVFRDIKRKGVEGLNSVEFYQHYAFLFFWGISLLRVLFVLPGGFWTLLSIYALIPLLNYIALKKDRVPPLRTN